MSVLALGLLALKGVTSPWHAAIILVLAFMTLGARGLDCDEQNSTEDALDMTVPLTITLQEGFHDDSVTIWINGSEQFHHDGVTTRLLLGYAVTWEAFVPPGHVTIQVEVPTREQAVSLDLEVGTPLYLGLFVEDGRLRYRTSKEPFGYM